MILTKPYKCAHPVLLKKGIKMGVLPYATKPHPKCPLKGAKI